MTKLDIIKEAYNKKQPISINYKGKNKNNCLVIRYDDKQVGFLWSTKQLDIPIDEFYIIEDYEISFYRDLICNEEFGMNWEALRNLLEYNAFHNTDDVQIEKIARTRTSKPKRIYATINDKNIVAAMTYGTVTGIRLENGTIISQRFSVTSSQWQRRIL